MSRAVLHLDTGLTLRGGQRQVLLLMRALRDRGWRNTLAAPPDSTLAQRAAAEGFALLPFAPRNDLDLVAADAIGREDGAAIGIERHGLGRGRRRGGPGRRQAPLRGGS